jgi:hypothetical protein
MATPTNILEQVITYQKSDLAYLQNLNVFFNIANTKFKDFTNISANLGSTVSFDLPYRFRSASGLVASFQGIEQRVHSLSVNQSENVSYTTTNQERIFNLEKTAEGYPKGYMDAIGKGAVYELGSKVESNLALNAISGVVDDDPESATYGQKDSSSGPYRFYGNGITAINSYQQLAQMIANFKNYGSVKQGLKVILPDTIVPPIIGSGLTQFAPKRNDDIAMSWEIGEFGTPPVMYYQSNLLPIHVAGTVGNTTSPGNELTLVSTNDPSGENITQLTFSGAGASDPDAIKEGDLLEFIDVAGLPHLRYLTFVGHVPSDQPVQIRAIANAESDGAGNVTIKITPTLSSTFNKNQNLNTALQPGMKALVAPSHKAGLVCSDNALFLAMPRLPNEDPFPTSAEYDEETGVSMRVYYGSLFGQNQRGLVHDCIWGSTLVPEYTMRILFPL